MSKDGGGTAAPDIFQPGPLSCRAVMQVGPSQFIGRFLASRANYSGSFVAGQRPGQRLSLWAFAVACPAVAPPLVMTSCTCSHIESHRPTCIDSHFMGFYRCLMPFDETGSLPVDWLFLYWIRCSCIYMRVYAAIIICLGVGLCAWCLCVLHACVCVGQECCYSCFECLRMRAFGYLLRPLCNAQRRFSAA